MEKESVRKDSRKVGSVRLDFTLSRFQKSGLSSLWVTLLPLVEQVPHHLRAGPRSHCFPDTACPLVGWSGHSALKLGLAEWFVTFLLSTGCLLASWLPLQESLRPVTQMHHRGKKCSSCC